jgi:hypothetical protein
MHGGVNLPSRRNDMHETPSVLAAWSNYYVITGSSAAALTGLMFVVVTLVAGRPSQPLDVRREGTSTFSTPTVVHFCAAFFVSGVLSAPWPTLAYPRTILAIGAACGIVYVIRKISRTTSLRVYTPDLEDWIWFNILPLVAYAAIAVAAIIFAAVPAQSLFVLAGATMSLIFIGIHNAWDVVTFIAIDQSEP